MSNLVRYQGYSPEQANQDAAKVDSISGNVYLELNVGDNVVRFLPANMKMAGPLRITAMHFIDAVPGLDKMLVFACPRVELKEPCMACAEAERLARSINPVDRERAYKISAGLRVFANVIPRGIEQTSPDPSTWFKVVTMGKMIHNQIKSIRNNPRLGGDFTDPTENGFDVIISREGTGKNDTKYTVAADRNNSPLHPDPEVVNWLIENQPDLERHVNPVVPEDLIRAWEAMSLRQAHQPQASAGGARGSVVTSVSNSVSGAGPRAGATVMSSVRRPTASVAVDAANPAEVEYDEDFNPIKK